MDKKKLIYLAGKISADSHWEFLKNIRMALYIGNKLIKCNYAVYIPHLDFLLFLNPDETLIPTRDEIFFNSFEMLRRCDELWVLPNSQDSKGVKKEIEEAKKLGIPIKFLGEAQDADF